MSVPTNATVTPVAGRSQGRHQHLGGAASKSYNVASVWEQSAALSENQLKALEKLSALCTQRPYPAHVKDDQGYNTETSHQQSTDSYTGTLEEAVLHNTNQFHKWHSELEAACASETEEKYKRYADLLNSHLRSCEDILLKVEQTLECFDALLSQHRDVSLKSKVLYGSCEQLVREKDQSVEFADALRAKLKFFDEFETVQSQFQAAQLSLDNESLLKLLKKLDDCLAYVAANPQYADSALYLTKFRQLQGRALGAVRSKIQNVLRQAVQQVTSAVREATGANPANGSQGLAEGSEVPLVYVRFRAAVEPATKGLVSELESRSGRPEYVRLLSEVHTAYTSARLQLMSPVIAARLKEAEGQALPLLTRAGCEHLLRVCQAEGALFAALFPGCKELSEPLAALLGPLATVLYDALRPAVVVMQGIDELCELIDILKHEVLGEQLARRGGVGCDALRPTLSRCLADVQARLIYRAQAYIKDEIAGYQPMPADLNYPAVLEIHKLTKGQTGNNEHASESNGADEASSSAPSVMFAPTTSTLLLLSKIYRALDTKIFAGLAQEAVAAATSVVSASSRSIARSAGPLDAQLFVIRHLLYLREQVAPFDVDFAATEVDLDFTHMRDHMRRILSGEVSLFSLSSNNAVVAMLGRSGPRATSHQRDSKKELEKALKAVCEAHIMALTKVAVEPMLSFITKVTAVRVSAASGAAAQEAGSTAPTSAPLREQAFASPARLLEVVTRVNEALRDALPRALARVALYLTNPSTRAILLKPVKSNIAEAHAQIAYLLENEYKPEEASTVPLMKPAELAQLMDSF